MVVFSIPHPIHSLLSLIARRCSLCVCAIMQSIPFSISFLLFSETKYIKHDTNEQQSIYLGHNTGYKSYDPSRPCKKCWSKYGKPFSGPLAFSFSSPVVDGGMCYSSYACQLTYSYQQTRQTFNDHSHNSHRLAHLFLLEKQTSSPHLPVRRPTLLRILHPEHPVLQGVSSQGSGLLLLASGWG